MNCTDCCNGDWLTNSADAFPRVRHPSRHALPLLKLDLLFPLFLGLILPRTPFIKPLFHPPIGV